MEGEEILESEMLDMEDLEVGSLLMIEVLGQHMRISG